MVVFPSHPSQSGTWLWRWVVWGYLLTVLGEANPPLTSVNEWVWKMWFYFCQLIDYPEGCKTLPSFILQTGTREFWSWERDKKQKTSCPYFSVSLAMQTHGRLSLQGECWKIIISVKKQTNTTTPSPPKKPQKTKQHPSQNKTPKQTKTTTKTKPTKPKKPTKKPNRLSCFHQTTYFLLWDA